MPPLTTATRIVAVAVLGTAAVAGVATSRGNPGPAGTTATSATTTPASAAPSPTTTDPAPLLPSAATSSAPATGTVPATPSPTTTPTITPAPTTTSAPVPASTPPACEGVQHAPADGTGHQVFQRGRVTDAGSVRLSVRGDDGTTNDYALDVNTAYGRDQAGRGPRPQVGDRVVVAGRERGGVLVAWWVAPDDGCVAD